MAAAPTWTDNGDGTWKADGPGGLRCVARPAPDPPANPFALSAAAPAAPPGAWEGLVFDIHDRRLFVQSCGDAASARAAVDSFIVGLP